MDLVKRFEVYWVDLDPTQGSEIQKRRPCLVVSPDDLNAKLATVIIAPITSTLKGWPFRVQVRFLGKQGEVALDQIRTVDQSRLHRPRAGVLEKPSQNEVLRLLGLLFAR